MASVVYKAPYVVPAMTKHTATVIMAHGLGDTSVFVPAVQLEADY